MALPRIDWTHCTPGEAANRKAQDRRIHSRGPGQECTLWKTRDFSGSSAAGHFAPAATVTNCSYSSFFPVVVVVRAGKVEMPRKTVWGEAGYRVKVLENPAVGKRTTRKARGGRAAGAPDLHGFHNGPGTGVWKEPASSGKCGWSRTGTEDETAPGCTEG
jgi:hypothetical protein